MGKYQESNEWKDVRPVAQDDSDGVAVINYPAEFVEVMDYFRAVVAAKDFSPRVMDLLDDLLERNPANYTAWQYRRLLLAHLAEQSPAEKSAIYNKELEVVSEVAEENPKNYQIWYHRQVLVGILFTPAEKEKASGELEFIKRILDDDAKNYHAWSYRQWVITHFDLWEQELPFTENLLASDVRNNSAWNQRYFVLSRGPQRLSDPETLRKEVEFTISKIRTSPNNESAWNYLKGIVNEKYGGHPSIKAFCLELRAKDNLSPSLLATLADIHAEENQVEEANKLFALLEEKVDTVHRKYWAYRKKQLTP